MSFTEQLVQLGFSISLLVNAALFIPQIITLLKRKTTEGVSLITFVGFNIIQLFTIFHGLLVGDYLLAGGYLLSFIACGSVSILIIYYRYIIRKLGNKPNEK
ncbi:PQ-loop domain-containing transporter [Legionella sp.]|uniref:PQ-loop domain-containing transporter n=1 Tax=Legionella sp. TaxID=459 RepID=UPI00321FF284